MILILLYWRTYWLLVQRNQNYAVLSIAVTAKIFAVGIDLSKSSVLGR
jgi:hypothetical protein